MSLHIKYFGSYCIFRAARRSTQVQLAGHRTIKRHKKAFLCLTLIKKLFRPFAVEIRVVGLRPDVSTDVGMAAERHAISNLRETLKFSSFSLYLAGRAMYIANRARKSMLHLYRILFGLRNIRRG
jgi:hypothetical protein